MVPVAGTLEEFSYEERNRIGHCATRLGRIQRRAAECRTKRVKSYSASGHDATRAYPNLSERRDSAGASARSRFVSCTNDHPAKPGARNYGQLAAKSGDLLGLAILPTI